MSFACFAFAYWHYRANGRRAYSKSTTVEGFVVYSFWRVENQREDLLYILAYPDGNKAGGGMATSYDSYPGDHGVFSNPVGIFVRGQNRLTTDDNPSVWMYLTTEPGGDVRKLDIPSEMVDHYSPKDFDSLATSKLWKEKLRPALVEESICFSEWYLRTHGTRSPARFSRQ